VNEYIVSVWPKGNYQNLVVEATDERHAVEVAVSLGHVGSGESTHMGDRFVFWVERKEQE
jgi:hypothetical protein